MVHQFSDSQLTDSLTQTGQRHGGQMDGLHGVGPLVQCPQKLEIEDATDQAADAAGGEEDHLKEATKGQTDRHKGEDSQRSSATTSTQHLWDIPWPSGQGA